MIRTLAILLLFAASGCGVKKATHRAALDQIKTLEGELSATQRERDKLKDRNQALGDDLEDTAAERDAKKAQTEKLAKEMAATAEELTELRKQRDAQEKRLAAFKDLNNRFRALVDTGKLQVVFRNGQMVLKLPSGVLFASGKASLSKGGEAALTEVLDVLQDFKDRRFLIAGHTDNVPIRSRKFKNNWALSTARAVSVTEFMITQGFAPQNLGAAGYGEFDPVAPNDTTENKALNRRIEIILVPDLSELPNLTADS